jgi:hypothetical protein
MRIRQLNSSIGLERQRFCPGFAANEIQSQLRDTLRIHAKISVGSAGKPVIPSKRAVCKAEKSISTDIYPSTNTTADTLYRLDRPTAHSSLHRSTCEEDHSHLVLLLTSHANKPGYYSQNMPLASGQSSNHHERKLDKIMRKPMTLTDFTRLELMQP